MNIVKIDKIQTPKIGEIALCFPPFSLQVPIPYGPRYSPAAWLFARAVGGGCDNGLQVPSFHPRNGISTASCGHDLNIPQKRSTFGEVLGYFKLVRWLPVQENV